jgi:chaperone modulatory protein CbpM
MKLKEREVVEQLGTLTLTELRLWVSEGWVTPEEDRSFAEIDVARIRLVCQLRQDMNLNEDAVPVVLSLLDQLHGLRSELQHLAKALEEQPEDVKRRVASAYRRRVLG